jgi:predicted HTH domain antitoxin
VDEKWLAGTGLSLSEAEAEFKSLLAARLFDLRRITLLQAARMAEMDVWQFADYLASMGSSPMNLPDEALLHDLAQA